MDASVAINNQPTRTKNETLTLLLGAYLSLVLPFKNVSIIILNSHDVMMLMIIVVVIPIAGILHEFAIMFSRQSFSGHFQLKYFLNTHLTNSTFRIFQLIHELIVGLCTFA